MTRTKIFVFTLLSAFCAAGLHGQSAVTDSVSVLLKKTNAAMKARDYAESARLIDQTIAYTKAQNDPYLNKNAVYALSYYNLACIQALEGKKEAAIEAFTKAVDSGYGNFRWALKDTDLKIIQDDPAFAAQIQRIRENYDYPYVLSHSGAYKGDAPDADLPPFTYLSQNDPRLVSLRKTLKLDSIAGSGDEISKIKNLCLWVHNAVRHDGGAENPKEKNAPALLKVCKEENRGINCRMMSTILNECYLAMGFKSRFITCMPKDENDFDCHVVNIVWSDSLGKWIMADPTFYAFFSDDKGELISIEDARQALVEGKQIHLNPEANWNGQKKNKAEYIAYMTKNFYWFMCPLDSTYDTETVRKGVYYMQLLPGDFKSPSNDYISRDPARFWARPE